MKAIAIFGDLRLKPGSAAKVRSLIHSLLEVEKPGSFRVYTTSGSGIPAIVRQVVGEDVREVPAIYRDAAHWELLDHCRTDCESIEAHAFWDGNDPNTAHAIAACAAHRIPITVLPS